MHYALLRLTGVASIHVGHLVPSPFSSQLALSPAIGAGFQSSGLLLRSSGVTESTDPREALRKNFTHFMSATLL